MSGRFFKLSNSFIIVLILIALLLIAMSVSFTIVAHSLKRSFTKPGSFQNIFAIESKRIEPRDPVLFRQSSPTSKS
jgi:hypothetical protein